MIKIKTSNGIAYNVGHFIFKGGEVQTKVEGWNGIDEANAPDQYAVIAHISDSNDLMSVMQISHKLKAAWPYADSVLVMHYIPYAQQDRMCEQDETLACKVFAQMINSLGYGQVLVADSHSDVMPALIDNCTNASRTDIINGELRATLTKTVCHLVSPDAGALKKTYSLAKDFGVGKIIRADKIRDTKTGSIVETVVYAEDLNGAHCVIVDDICVGGRTFIELAKKLKQAGAGLITLYVTHGIFSNGVQDLLSSGITSIYTTDSRIRTDELNAQLNIISL